jgi:hypothetical protein
MRLRNPFSHSLQFMEFMEGRDEPSKLNKQDTDNQKPGAVPEKMTMRNAIDSHSGHTDPDRLDSSRRGSRHVSLCSSSSQQDGRADQQNHTNCNNCSLRAKHSRNAVSRNPARLKISYGKTTASSPHVDDGTDNSGLIRVFLEGKGSNGPKGKRC